MTLLLLRPLRHRGVRLLWGGLTLSAIGDQLYAVALVWVAVGVLGPAAGYLSALQAACGLMAALFVGRWADGWEHRRAMAGADALRAAVLIGLVAWWLLRGGGAPAPALTVAIVVLAAGDAVFRPALAATLPTLLPDRTQLPAANALFDTTQRSARLLGPGLIGLLAGLLPVVHFFTVDAATFALSALAILRLGPGRRHAGIVHGSVLASIGHGFAVVRRHRALWSVLLTLGAVNGAWVAAYYLGLPLLVEQAHITGPGGTGLGAYGLVLSAYGCTNLLGTLVIGSRPLPRHPGRMMFAGTAVLAVGVLGLAAGGAGGLPALMAAAAVGAVGGPLGDIPVAVLRQTEIPARDIAAAMRAFLVANYAGTMVAMLAAPALAHALGGAVFLLACGLVLAGLAAWGLARHWRDGRTPGDAAAVT